MVNALKKRGGGVREQNYCFSALSLGEINGYFVYFSVVVQIFCNETKMKHSELFKE